MAQGRIWTGEKAKELGLVDLLGGLDTALEVAINKAEVEQYTIMNYPAKSSFFEELMEGGFGNTMVNHFMARSKAGQLMQQIDRIEQFTDMDPIQARIPFDLNLQ